jgi:hypothetical protein
MDALLAGFTWPPAEAGQRAATPVLPCAAPLRLRRAATRTPDMVQMLIGGVVDLAPGTGPAPIYCRDPGAAVTMLSGVYRANEARDSYLIALNDAGIALRLAPLLTLEALTGTPNSGGVGLTLLERESVATLASFTRLPPPEQALEALGRNRGPTISVQQRR